MRRSISAFATPVGDRPPVALVDLLGRRLDVGLGGLLLLGEERLQVLAKLVEDRQVVGEAVEDLVDDLVDLLVERILRAHRRRPAEAGLRERVDEQARGMRLLREERPVEHRRLEHGNLQPREQRLDAVGEVASLEDEVEQHRDQLDRHRLELVRLLAERRLLKVAQHVVRALRDSRELDERAAAEVEAGLARLQPRETLAQRRRRDDRRARHVARRRRRQRTGRDVAHAARPARAHVDRREVARRPWRRRGNRAPAPGIPIGMPPPIHAVRRHANPPGGFGPAAHRRE